MFRTSVVLAAAVAVTACSKRPPSRRPGGPGAASKTSALDIPFERYKLANGLTVIVHEDHKAPIVAVSMWYNVGSKDEPKGKTGFAHLFEHLMFNGTENLPGDYFTYLQEIGATDYNGTTSNDRTNYFETVPRGALERTLFMESDRMGYLLGAVTQLSPKRLLPTVKSPRSAAPRFRAGSEYAARVTSTTVVAPPEFSSPGS